MKSKRTLSILLAACVVLLLPVTGFALAGGMPAAHGVTGPEFGAAVSDLARSEPGAVAAHVGMKPDMQEEDSEEEPEDPDTDGSEMAGGMPAAHGLTGREFGAAVSALAKSEPGAVAAHVGDKPDMEVDEPEDPDTDGSEMAGGMPAAHGLTGKEFGAAVSELARTEPGAVADHVRTR